LLLGELDAKPPARQHDFNGPSAFRRNV
jgi:hypothetical protein